MDITETISEAVGRHPWVNQAGLVDPTKAGCWTANLILMSGGSAVTAFQCATLVAKDITENPNKFRRLPEIAS